MSNKNVILADSSELILKGLKSILQPLVQNDICLAINFNELKEKIKSLKNILLIIDYTSSGFSLNELVELKNNYPNIIMMAVTPYTNAQTIVEAIKAGVESHIKECSVNEIKDAFNATLNGKVFCDDIVKQMQKENINPNKVF